MQNFSNIKRLIGCLCRRKRRCMTIFWFWNSTFGFFLQSSWGWAILSPQLNPRLNSLWDANHPLIVCLMVFAPYFLRKYTPSLLHFVALTCSNHTFPKAAICKLEAAASTPQQESATIQIVAFHIVPVKALNGYTFEVNRYSSRPTRMQYFLWFLKIKKILAAHWLRACIRSSQKCTHLGTFIG